MTKTSATTLRIVLFLGGAFIVFTGLNVAFGGILTLGWQGQTAFFEVTDEPMFLVQDSHIRFLGGLWLGVGGLFLLSVTNLLRYQLLLKYSFALIFLGGLARLSQMQLAVTLGSDIIGSFAAELVGMPLLYVWLSRVMSHTGEEGTA